jgi:hypothetical protein
MTDHFSPIGFLIESEDDFKELLNQIEEVEEVISVKKGTYIRWSSECGAELWLQADRKNRFIGGSPHFSGASRTEVGLATKVQRPYDNALEGAFKAWADPPPEDLTSGAYPFVFDAPDFAVYSEVQLPSLATAQISAFAEEITIYESTEAFLASQTAEHKLAPQSFIPLGLFPDTGQRTEPAEARAMLTGEVVKAEEKVNDLSREPFIWALVETFGGTYDVVVSSSMIDEMPVEGSVVSGSFWLSGRLLDYARQERRGLRRLLGRG